MVSPAPSSKKGFTLIELLVAVTISLLFLGAVIAGYRNFLGKRTLVLAGEEVKNNLRLVRAKAIHGEKPTSCVDFGGYQVDLSENEFSWQALCGGLPAGEKKLLAINAEINLSVTQGSFPFSFFPLAGTASDEMEIEFSYLGKKVILTVAEKSGTVSLGEVSDE